MAQAKPPNTPATHAPAHLRLLERSVPPPLRGPAPAHSWTARLGRWVDRLLVS